MTRVFSHFLGRGVLATILLVSAVAGGAYWHYRSEVGRLEAVLAAENDRLMARQRVLEAMVERLSHTRRLAQIVVTSQTHTPDGQVAETTFLMTEIGTDGEPLARRNLMIPGEVAYFDGLVVKFHADSVAAAHPLRGQSLVLLRRVYGETQSPQNGIPLDEPGEVPPSYQTREKPSEFECRIWERFWTLANDPHLAAEMGVRVAQGEAVYKPLQPGYLYELTLDAVGGLNIETRALPEAVAEVLSRGDFGG